MPSRCPQEAAEEVLAALDARLRQAHPARSANRKILSFGLDRALTTKLRLPQR